MTIKEASVTIAQDVERAAKMMDKRKPGWFRRIVFKRLDMNMACDCIAGQSGLDWAELEDAYEERYPDAITSPFAARETEHAWKDEVRRRKAATR